MLTGGRLLFAFSTCYKPVSKLNPERASRSVARRRHRPSSVGTPGDNAMPMAKKRHAAEPEETLDYRRQSAHGHSRRARAPVTFIMVLSSLALLLRYDNDLHCVLSTAPPAHSQSFPLAGRTHHLPVRAASEFGHAAMARSSCGRDTRSCPLHALGTRAVRERLCDCTVLCVGCARTGHGCQSDRYYSCAGPCAASGNSDNRHKSIF